MIIRRTQHFEIKLSQLTAITCECNDETIQLKKKIRFSVFSFVFLDLHYLFIYLFIYVAQNIGEGDIPNTNNQCLGSQ